eukprot:1840674-Rhodomonas_salina.1
MVFNKSKKKKKKKKRPTDKTRKSINAEATRGCARRREVSSARSHTTQQHTPAQHAGNRNGVQRCATVCVPRYAPVHTRPLRVLASCTRQRDHQRVPLAHLVAHPPQSVPPLAQYRTARTIVARALAVAHLVPVAHPPNRYRDLSLRYFYCAFCCSSCGCVVFLLWSFRRRR